MVHKNQLQEMLFHLCIFFLVKDFVCYFIYCHTEDFMCYLIYSLNSIPHIHVPVFKTMSNQKLIKNRHLLCIA